MANPCASSDENRFVMDQLVYADDLIIITQGANMYPDLVDRLITNMTTLTIHVKDEKADMKETSSINYLGQRLSENSQDDNLC